MKKILLSLLYSIVVSCALFSHTFAMEFTEGVEHKSEKKFSVSTIDLQDSLAAAKFYGSLKDTGFALITNHGIDYVSVQQKLREFFAQDEAYKEQFHNRNYPDTRLGHYPLGVENAAGSLVKNQMEYIHYAAGHAVFSEELNAIIEPYFQAMLALTRTFAGWLDQVMDPEIKAALPDGLSFTELLTEELPYTIMRGLRYPACAPSETDTVLNDEHTDISFFSLLFATAPGLQLKDNAGRWHDVGGAPDMLVVNAGDMLQWLTNYHIRSTRHRVVKKAAIAGESTAADLEDRISLPVFVGVHSNTVVQPGITAKEAFDQRMRENGVAIA